MSPSILSNLVRIRLLDNNFRYQNILQVPKARTTKYGMKSLRFAAAVLWNSFPDNFSSGEVFSKLKSRGFRATSLSTYDFSTPYTPKPHNLIKVE